MLLKAALEENVSIETGRRAGRITPGNIPKVQFEDGESSRAEFIIAADGLKSVGRRALNNATDARFTGQVAWRALVPGTSTHPQATVTMGPGRHIVSYPLRGGRLVNLVAVQEREEWAEEGWNHPDDPENLRAAFTDFGGPVAGLLAQVAETSLWGLFRHPVADKWVQDNVALIGDAAHPTLPFLAQGANMALEDAWALTDCLTKSSALKEFEYERRKRTSKIVEAASRNAWKYHLRAGPTRWAAHTALSLGSRLAPGLLMKQFDWIYRHDVTRETG